MSDFCNPMECRQPSLSFTISQSSLKLMSIESMMASYHFMLCHSLLLLFSVFPRTRVFSKELTLHIRWPKYWSFSFNFRISQFNEYLGLISFRIEWFDFLAFKGLSGVFSSTIAKSINSWTLSLIYDPTLTSIYDYWKNHNFWLYGPLLAKWWSLPFNMLSRFLIAFLPRSKHLLISWLQSPSAVILELKKIKSVTVSTVAPSIFHEVMGPDAMIFTVWMLSFK